MSEAVQVQLVVVFGSVITAIITTIGIVIVAMLNRASTRQKQVLDHVQNEHKKADGTPLNLRDDLDEKFEGVSRLVRGAITDIGGIRQELRALRDDDTDQRDRLRRLEHTQPRHKE